ncbi:hypothetical protein [Nitrosomonas ureae]|uniref:Uncharacterized protein n=1 Tax=Nitrosomonas ureae TaxID=44577 RepID=A0A1H2EAD5_9PROT|nr:hypothetical protein [Nitrosomonas ureae]ALQ51977.1 hypothetical protein ATY38_12570 [Nitrosomonas ureae]SDT91994.1 hypothetical protein SAMN05216406_11089 [Nitrosomonas ureae]
MKRVPSEITFGYKILEIPTLAEMGIPLAGLSDVVFDSETENWSNPESCWIDRGEPILSYSIINYSNAKKTMFSFMNDPVNTEKYEITAPISGIFTKIYHQRTQEYSLNFDTGLQYQWTKIFGFPVILIPNEEPLPEHHNFYVYDEISSHFYYNFDAILIRDQHSVNPERLRSYIERKESGTRQQYLNWLNEIKQRESSNFRNYKIREISEEDKELVNNIQQLRAKDLQLRNKLAHIARDFGESI